MESSASTNALIDTIALCAQTVGILIAIVFGMYQLRGARRTLDAAARALEFSLRTEVSNIYMHIHQAALQHPEIAGEYAGLKRLHIMRLHYLFRIYSLHKAGFLGAEEHRANGAYLAWLCKQEEFREVWQELRDQYDADFSSWMEEKMEPNGHKMALIGERL